MRLRNRVLAARTAKGLGPGATPEVDSRHATLDRPVPFDWPEYAWLEWNQVPRVMLERMLGEPWLKALGASAEGPQELPESWGVMF
jgi:hypothetical protein